MHDRTFDDIYDYYITKPEHNKIPIEVRNVMGIKVV